MGSTKRFYFADYEIQLANLYKALGHPARIRIIELLLSNGRLNCKGLNEYLRLAPSSILKHIHVLYEANIVGYENAKNSSYYVVNPKTMEVVQTYLGELKQRTNSRIMDYTYVYFQPEIEIDFN